ncbi:uncharacterized protein HD556DRAFT_1302870 [Suillus plorans]|uniref:Uncharacterized protein n=1 Tax=Suillus plorans TaxID=116603 RepID=A0A9P7DYN7_9AGAM|nr:uncharacterized protein HD556DRAFT_1302870 [Suillus plorans]KAG1806380.1 hypothetical protein HD556DRAFT_1302870 [Suillus plorans]
MTDGLGGKLFLMEAGGPMQGIYRVDEWADVHGYLVDGWAKVVGYYADGCIKVDVYEIDGHDGAEREARLLERCPPGHEGKRLVDEPATILDTSGAIIAWYLPDALTDTTQKEIREATNLPPPSLEKSVRADGNWRTNQKWFKWGSDNVSTTPGCINLSLAWFQQGHKNVSDPEVSASLKGPSCENILKAIARPAAITSTALRVMHPEQYWAGL